MKDDELTDFANQFIQTWQENFAKLGSDNQLMELFTTNMHNMQQFYDKSSSTTFGNSPSAGVDESKWRDIERRLNKIERKLESFEQIKTGDKKRSAK